MEKQLKSSGQISKDLQHWLFSGRSRRTWQERIWSRRTSKTGSSLCPCWTTSSGKRMMRIASRSPRVKNYANKFLPEHWTFLGPGSEKRWYGTSYDRPWDRTANKRVQQLKEIGHPIFRVTSAFESRNVEAKKWQKIPIFSMEIAWTQNYDFKHLILWIKSVSTRLSLYTEYTSWSMPQHTLSREHTLRTPWLKEKLRPRHS